MGLYDLVTLAEAKEHLGVFDNDQDFYFSTLIERVTGTVERHTRRKLKTRTYTDELYDGSGTNVLRLKEWPVTSVTAVSFLDSQTSSTWTSQTLTYLVIDQETDRSIVFRDGTTFPRDFQNVKLTFVAGLTTIEPELKLETLRLLMLMHRLKDKQFEAVESVSFQGQTTKFPTVKQFLDESEVLAYYSRRDF